MLLLPLPPSLRMSSPMPISATPSTISLSVGGVQMILEASQSAGSHGAQIMVSEFALARFQVNTEHKQRNAHMSDPALLCVHAYTLAKHLGDYVPVDLMVNRARHSRLSRRVC